MKNMKLAKMVALASLFSLIPFLPPAKAQSQSSLPKLEGTAWRVTTMAWYPIQGIPIVYGFAEGGRADVIALITYLSIATLPNLYYDRSGDGWKVEPGTMQSNSGVIQHTGTYKQTGTSIHLEFSDHIIDATIKGNRMEGEIRSTQFAKIAKQSKWTAEKVSSNTVTKEKDKLNNKPMQSSTISADKSDGGVLALADDLSVEVPRSLFVRTFEGRVSGSIRIEPFSEVVESGLITLQIDFYKQDSLKVSFTLSGMSGELSGELSDGRLQLQGVGIVKATLSEARYQCVVTGLFKEGTLNEGKYYCASGKDVLQGVFQAVQRETIK